VDEGVEDGRHEEIGDTSSSVTKASGECVGRAHHVLVKKAGGPNLTWDKATAEYANEESDCKKAFGVGDCTCHYSWYRASQQAACEGVSRSIPITHGSSDESNEKTSQN